MVGLQTLDLAIGVRVPASQPKSCLTILKSIAGHLIDSVYDARKLCKIGRKKIVCRSVG